MATTFGQRGRPAWFSVIPLGDDEDGKNGDGDERVPGGDQHQRACVGRHFDEAMEQPARHTNDDGSRTTSRALVGSETPKRRKKRKIVEEGGGVLTND